MQLIAKALFESDKCKLQPFIADILITVTLGYVVACQKILLVCGTRANSNAIQGMKFLRWQRFLSGDKTSCLLSLNGGRR